MVDQDKQNIPTRTGTAPRDTQTSQGGDTRNLTEADRMRILNCKIDTLADLGEFEYRTDNPSPEMNDEYSAGFRQSIELAHLVNTAQWPKAGSGSYDKRCVDIEREKFEGRQRATAPGDGPPQPSAPDRNDAGDPPTQVSMPQPETASGQTRIANPATVDETPPAPTDAAQVTVEPADSATSAAPPQQGPPFDVIVAQRCLVPYEDPYRLRALSRLIAITDDLRAGSRAVQARLAAQAANQLGASKQAETAIPVIEETVAKATMQKRLGDFGQILPGVATALGVPDDATMPATIADLESEMQRLIEQRGRLRELARYCAPLLDTALPRKDGADDFDTAIEYTRCRFLLAPSGNMRVMLADFIVARVVGDLDKFYHPTAPALTDFLEIKTDGCALTDCRIRVDLREGADEADLARKLASALDSRTNGLSIYEISPRAGSIIRTAGRGSDLSARLSGPPGELSAGSAQGERTAYAEPAVLGFSAPVPANGFPAEAEEAVFGWTVRPQKRPDGGWSSSHHRLSAVISVPSWWKRLDLEIHACWITPKLARNGADTLFDTPSNICNAVYGGDQTSLTSADDAEQTTPPPGHFKRSVRVQLPRSIDEVTARFNFDLVKTPYFDPAWRRDYEGAETALMAGRPAHIALAGERLWRGTVVTIDGQPADRITVLPDMKGVIAEFNCVRPSPRALTGTANQSRAKLTVWTAEGRTKPMDVDVRAFEAVQGTEEKPCYLRASEGDSETRPSFEAPGDED
jgi:hypothetical protein